MSPTKRDVIAEAFTEIGKGSYAFDQQPEEYQVALRRLDGMMAQWGATMGIRIGYSGGNGFGDINADVDVPDWAFAALYLNLAINLAPSYGKTVSPDTKAAAKAAIDALMQRSVVPTRRYLGGYSGAGHRGFYSMPPPASALDVGSDKSLDIEV